MALTPQRRSLVLGVLDDPTPVRPGERNDDPDLHAATAANARCNRSAPISISASVTATDSRAQPAPLEPNPSPGATATSMLDEQLFRTQPFGEAHPHVERSFGDGSIGKRSTEHVASSFVRFDPLDDRVLRPFECGDRRVLEWCEDADAGVVVEHVDALDDLCVSDDEPDAPTGHAVRLRHRPHLDADVFRAGG